MPLYEHYNEDGSVTLVNDPKDSDMTDIGSGLPDVTYGITLNAEYKGIDLTIFGAGAAGNDSRPCTDYDLRGNYNDCRGG